MSGVFLPKRHSALQKEFTEFARESAITLELPGTNVVHEKYMEREPKF